jgi:hypothetical protein
MPLGIPDGSVPGLQFTEAPLGTFAALDLEMDTSIKGKLYLMGVFNKLKFSKGGII